MKQFRKGLGSPVGKRPHGEWEKGANYIGKEDRDFPRGDTGKKKSNVQGLRTGVSGTEKKRSKKRTTTVLEDRRKLRGEGRGLAQKMKEAGIGERSSTKDFLPPSNRFGVENFRGARNEGGRVQEKGIA